MKPCGRMSATRSPSAWPSSTSPWNRLRSGPHPWRRRHSSATMKPTLWRCRAYCGPGLPRAAIRNTPTPTGGQREHPREAVSPGHGGPSDRRLSHRSRSPRAQWLTPRMPPPRTRPPLRPPPLRRFGSTSATRGDVDGDDQRLGVVQDGQTLGDDDVGHAQVVAHRRGRTRPPPAPSGIEVCMPSTVTVRRWKSSMPPSARPTGSPTEFDVDRALDLLSQVDLQQVDVQHACASRGCSCGCS